MIAKVVWKEDHVHESRSMQSTVSWAVLRPKTRTSTFNLLCWAILVDTHSNIDGTPTKDSSPLYSLTTRPFARINGDSHYSSSPFTGTLKLHYDDVLAFVAVARKGLHSLTIPATTPATGSRATFVARSIRLPSREERTKRF